MTLAENSLRISNLFLNRREKEPNQEQLISTMSIEEYCISLRVAVYGDSYQKTILNGGLCINIIFIWSKKPFPGQPSILEQVLKKSSEPRTAGQRNT